MSKSLREYVSEEELTFELYKLKYSKALKNITELSREQIIKNFEKDKKKKLSLIAKKVIKFQGDEKVQEVLQKNIDYINTLTPLLDIHQVQELWKEPVQEYVNYMTNTSKPFSQKELVLNENSSKEKFGKMLMLIVMNLGTKPCFGAYSRNWKDDFYSNAIENSLEFLHNFDKKLLSITTKKPVKSFAYITQICFNAFVQVIKDRKKEEELQRTILPYEVSLVEGHIINQEISPIQDENDYYFDHFELDSFTPDYTDMHLETDDKEQMFEEEDIEDELTEDTQIWDYNEINTVDLIDIKNSSLNLKLPSDKIKETLDKIEESNKNHKINKSIDKEISFLIANTPESEKDNDFFSYINDLDFIPCLYNREIKSVIIKTDFIPNLDKTYSFFIRISKE